METLEKKKKLRLKWILLPLPLIPMALFPWIASSPAAANFVTERVSRPVKAALGTVFGLLPFSVMELEYLAALLFVVVYTVRTVILLCRGTDKFKIFLRRAGGFLLAAALLFDYFLWFFAIDYRSDSFTEKSGLHGGAVETEALYTVTAFFIQEAARYSVQVRRDGEGHWAEPMDEYIVRSATVYENLHKTFPFLSARSRLPKKMLLTSTISSWMGFTGVYFPYSGESNINIDAPGCLIPETICHELAHQKGVYAEQEANFAGIAASVASGDPVYVYSGYLSGAIYLSNALYSADPELWYQAAAGMSEEMRIDWNDNNAYWKRFEGKVEEVSSKVYDGYLKAQGQELGIRSYGACVDLLVEYYLDAARTGLGAAS